MLLVILILLGAGLTFYNSQGIDKNLVLLRESEAVKREVRYGHDVITRHVDITMRGFAIIRDEKFNYISNTQIRKQMEGNFARLDSMLNAQHYANAEGWKMVQTYKDSIRSFVDYHAYMLDLLRKDSLDTFRKVFLTDKGAKLGPPFAAALAQIDAFEDQLNRQAVADYHAAVQNNIYVQVLMLLFGLPSILLVFRKLRSEARQRLKLLAALAETNRQYVFDSGQSHQLTETSVTTQTITNFQQASDFVKEITQGNYEVTWKRLTPANLALNHTTLAGALLNMKQRMQEVKTADEQRNWTNEGLSYLGEILRKETNPERLSDKILTELIKYINANQGMLFIVNDNDEKNPFLELKSTYAFNRKKYLGRQVKPGEGLAGQAWLEAETIYLKEIPEEYVKIRSGLGGANPANILVVPLKNESSVQGMLEIASFHEFEPHQIAFVEKMAESIAITFASTKVAEKTQKLLEETTAMTEQLQSQEEEMRQNMEELQTTQEEMYRSQREVSQREATLTALFDHTDSAVMALDTQLRILAFNKRMKNRFAEQGVVLKPGKEAREVLTAEQFPVWKAKFERALSGKAFRDSYENRHPKTGEVQFIEDAYFPIRNEENEVTGLSIYSDDVTEEYLLRKTIEEKQINLDTVLNNTDAAIVSLSRDYKILTINQQMKKFYKRQGIEMEEGANVLELLPPQEVKNRKLSYDRAFNGEQFSVVEEVTSPQNQQKLFYEIAHFPIVNEKYDVTGVSVFIKT